MTLKRLQQMTKIIIHEAFMINPGNAIPDKGSWGKKMYESVMLFSC